MALRLTVLFVLFSLATSAGAAATWHTAKITHVYPAGEGTHVVLRFDADSPACTNTNDSDYYYIYVGENGVTADGLKILLSTALAAAAAGKTVTINFDSASPNCYINRLWVAYP